MSLVKTREQRKAIQAIDLMFKGLDDPILKQALLTAYAGENPEILEEMKEQEQKDLEEMLKQMELQSVEEVYDASCNTVIEKSKDIIDGNNTSFCASN
jgi:polyribonucleotide nucleotidyltransferase